jgi:hypothetical protein
VIWACFGSAQDGPQDPFNKTSRIHDLGDIRLSDEVGRAGDQTCSHLPHYPGKRGNVIGTLGRSGEGPDEAIKSPASWH